MKVAIIGTTTHKENSTSWDLLERVASYLGNAEVRVVDASKLHIVKNLSCYAGGGSNCADPKAGPYRCWAHFNSEKEPELYGGRDEMPVIYDTLEWADSVIWGTSVRWGSHSAVLQNVIERMNNLENRVTVWGEKSPLRGKRAGVVVTGQHWKAQEVASHLLSVFGFFGFETNEQSQLVWQNTWDMNREQTGDNLSELHSDMKMSGERAVSEFVRAGLRLSFTGASASYTT